MTTKKLLIAAGLLLAGTSASLAQGYGYYGPYAAPSAPVYGTYGYAPAYGPGYDNYGWSSGPGFYDNDTDRGGPGPRVQSGSGAGIGAER